MTKTSTKFQIYQSMQFSLTEMTLSLFQACEHNTLSLTFSIAHNQLARVSESISFYWWIISKSILIIVDGSGVVN